MKTSPFANHRFSQREDMRDLERVAARDRRGGGAAPSQSSLSIELQNARGIRDRERRLAFEREAVFGHERAHQMAEQSRRQLGLRLRRRGVGQIYGF